MKEAQKRGVLKSGSHSGTAATSVQVTPDNRLKSTVTFSSGTLPCVPSAASSFQSESLSYEESLRLPCFLGGRRAHPGLLFLQIICFYSKRNLSADCFHLLFFQQCLRIPPSYPVPKASDFHPRKRRSLAAHRLSTSLPWTL